MDWRQSSAKARKFSRKAAFLSYSFSRMLVTPCGEVGDLLGELEDGFFPIGFVGLAVLEEELRTSISFSGSVMVSSNSMRLF